MEVQIKQAVANLLQLATVHRDYLGYRDYGNTSVTLRFNYGEYMDDVDLSYMKLSELGYNELECMGIKAVKATGLKATALMAPGDVRVCLHDVGDGEVRIGFIPESLYQNLRIDSAFLDELSI